jgi:predicted Fe-Mo cluster-binding NifX family protein
VLVGPIPGAPGIENGFGKARAFRIIVVNVDGREVEISFYAQERGSKHFQAAVDFVQPLIHSITWK